VVGAVVAFYFRKRNGNKRLNVYRMIVVPPEALRKSSFMHRYARKLGVLFRIFKPQY
jgi:hypothetical protein